LEKFKSIKWEAIDFTDNTATIEAASFKNSSSKATIQRENADQTRQWNQRASRDPVHLPPLEPLGDSKSWDFKTFPHKDTFDALEPQDKAVVGYVLGMHAACLFAPFFFSWSAVGVFLAGYVLTGLGITLSFHRQLTHKSFATPKWLEYTFAYLGALASQGDPIEWVSAHRYHHAHCDTEVDPHSPRDGAFWSHMGWIWNARKLKVLESDTNASDLREQPFYVWLKKTYAWQIVAQASVLFLLGGMPWLLWGFCMRTVLVWNVTWAVNSVCHIWGRQTFRTSDVSMNNPVVGLLALGEGWHNNHHAFEDSCRHGLKWWQIDFTWYAILLL